MDAGSTVVVKNYLECNFGGLMKRTYIIKRSGEYYAGPPLVPMAVVPPRWAIVIRTGRGCEAVAVPDWGFHQAPIIDLVETLDTTS